MEMQLETSRRTEHRGRPAETPINYGPRQFTRVFKGGGMTRTWIYDLDKQKNGPISCETEYDGDETPIAEAKIKLTDQQWRNPANGKLVGYTRAKMLGLIVK